MATIDILGVPHAYSLTPPTASPQVLVFLHGWLLSHNYWQPLIDRLAPDYQCLAYDLRGFGGSQPNNGVQLSLEEAHSSNVFPNVTSQAATLVQYTPAAYARDLGILLEKLNISSAWLVGHSLGGTIALWGAYQLPERVQGVICLNAGGGIYLKEAFERFRTAGQQMLKRRPQWLCYLPLLDFLLSYANVARPIARSWGRQRLLDFITAHPEAALGTLLDSTTEAEVNRLPQVLSELKQPVYFIAGAKDKIMEPKYVRHLASFHSLFKDCGDNVMEIPNCGHLAMLEQTEIVAEQICEILSIHKP